MRAGGRAQWAANGHAALVGAARKFKTGRRDREARQGRVVRLGCALSFASELADERLRFLGGFLKHTDHHAACAWIRNSAEPFRLRGKQREATGADSACRSFERMGGRVPNPVGFGLFESGNRYGDLGNEEPKNLSFEVLVAQRKAAQMGNIKGPRRVTRVS